jgi:DMSO reductase anchor subunit
MCHQRLAHGDAPACVQACPSEAIRITVVRQEDIGALYRTPQISSKTERNLFLPTSPNPAITLPTTRYVSKEMLPAEARSADPSVVKLQPAHRPLVWMLSLTQLGAGGFVVLPFASKVAQPFLALMSLAALLLGLAASILHLGRPEKAWRVFLGLRRSWLSREVVVFGAFTLLAIACTCATMLARPRGAGILLETITAAAGLSGVFCSGMAYHVTRRDCWRGEWSVGRFFASTLVLGLALAWCASAWVGSGQKVFALCLGAATLAKLSREFAFLRLCADDADLNDELPDTFAGRAAFLMRFRLGGLLRSRLTCAWAGGVAMPLIALIPAAAPVSLSLCGLLLCLAGEWLERAMFFRTAVTAEMPGGGA